MPGCAAACALIFLRRISSYRYTSTRYGSPLASESGDRTTDELRGIIARGRSRPTLDGRLAEEILGFRQLGPPGTAGDFGQTDIAAVLP